MAELERETVKPSFWDDKERAGKIASEVAELNEEIGLFEHLTKEMIDLIQLNELAVTEEDVKLSREVETEYGKTLKDYNEVEKRSLFSGEFDKNDAVVSLHPGAGGLESQDWAEMLLRMYLRWADKKKFKVDINDYQPDEEAGIKSVMFTVHGPYAFGLLEAEKGVHRLVRISPFDQAKRRHTSFVSVDAIPLIEVRKEIEIKPEDLRIDTYRSSGAGGQHVNVTDSAVRIVHLPTGVTVQCQNERSQLKNKQTAMKILKARLFDRMRKEQEKKIEELRGQREDIAFGSQIRSYVFHPYRMVKDHRTDIEIGDADRVINGDIDEFIDAYLRKVKR